jgi:hypothetical protein
MDQYRIYRVQIDYPAGVASIVAACCKQGERFYAEYLVLYELHRPHRICSWFDSEETAEAEPETILQHALTMAKNKLTSEGMGDIYRKKLGDDLAYGDEQYIEILKDRYMAEVALLYAKANIELKCQCLKDLLKVGKLRS